MATQSTEQTVRLAPFQEEFLADIFASAKGLTGTGTQMPFSAQQLAALSPGQQQAISRAMSGVGSFEPFLQKGTEAIGQGIGQLGTAQQRVAAAGIDPSSYQQFMNPFMEDVIQKQYQDIADQGAKQQTQLGASAVGAGAFGGSRQGIAQGEIAANVLDQQARTGAQLRSAGFQQAQNLAQQAAQQQLRQAQLTGQLGQSVGQLGMQTAGLGQLGQQMGVQDVNTLLGIGGLQQGQDQRQLDVTRANQLAQQALPFQRIGFMSDIFRGVPALQQTYSTTTTPPPSRTSQLLGLGIAGLGAAGSAGGIGNLFNTGVRPT
jgi:F0F1-type ATP synthase membrane subunit c/vacuolar-type H+-ATPase subunit K